MQNPSTAGPAPAELPIVTLAKNVNASNVGTGRNLAAVSNYYTRLAINDNNFLRVRGYLLSEAGLALSASSVPVSLGGFVASFFTISKDILNVVSAALAITTSSIALLRALPAAPTAGVTSAAIAANLASLRGRHLLDAQHDENATHAEVFAANQSRAFEQFSKTAFSNGDNPQNLYCSVTTNIARINLLQDGLDTVQTILSNPTAAFDGLTPSHFTSVFTDSNLASANLQKLGPGVTRTFNNNNNNNGNAIDGFCSAPLQCPPAKLLANGSRDTSVPLCFTKDQLAQNQSNFNTILRQIPTILIFPLAQPGEPNFIGTGLTANQSSNLAFIAAEIALAASIINEVANILAITGDVITYLLRFPSLAIQVGQLEISAITFESTLERDYSPGGAAYADLQRFLTAIDTYRRALGQGSLQSMVTNAQKQLNTARSMLVGTVAPKSA
ncbi:MAG: hypothetical protein WDW36_007936 [Sanguina aurantia]